MKTIRYLAIASLLVPLGVVTSSCYQDPPETGAPDADQDDSEYAESDQDQADSAEATESSSEGLIIAQCRPYGWGCAAGWQCCTGACIYGVCGAVIGGYPGYPGYGYPGYGYPYYCRTGGSVCNWGGQCCSGTCWYGVCQARYY